MKNVMVFVLAAVFAAGCSVISPDTVKNAVKGHQEFPSLSILVQECVQGTESEVLVAVPFNVLVDKWEAARDLQPDAGLIKVLVGAQDEVREARNAWVQIKNEIVGAGLTCDPAVQPMVANIEKTFTDITGALKQNERLVTVGEWALLISRALVNPHGQVIRMAAQ